MSFESVSETARFQRIQYPVREVLGKLRAVQRVAQKNRVTEGIEKERVDERTSKNGWDRWDR